jgi:hypothetical protein
MDDESNDVIAMILLAALALGILIILTSGCRLLAVPGVDNHKSIFSQPYQYETPR